MQKLLHQLDNFQQRHRLLAFGYAVVAKFGQDQASNQAALIAYYAFLSLFPLLLVAVTVLQLVMSHNPAARAHIINALLASFPALGTQLQHNVHSLHATGFTLAISLVLTLFGALGIASALQNAFNHVWRVPLTKRPPLLSSYARSLGLLLTIGLGMIVSTTVTGYATGGHHAASLRVIAFILAFVINVAVFWIAFILGTARSITRREVFLGAVIAAFAWLILQALGSFLVLRQIQHTSALYGTFALVLGLMWWLYLQAQITVYAMEINVVKVQKLWPRSFFAAPSDKPLK
jgi:membrane protein